MKERKEAFVKVMGGDLYPYMKDVEIYGRIRTECENDFVVYGCDESEEPKFYEAIYAYDLANGFIGFESVADVEDFWVNGGDGSFLTIDDGDYEIIKLL